MRSKEEVTSGTYNPHPNKKDKPQKDPDHKGLLDSTKHTTFEGPRTKVYKLHLTGNGGYQVYHLNKEVSD